jgi:hypothetical protein
MWNEAYKEVSLASRLPLSADKESLHMRYTGGRKNTTKTMTPLRKFSNPDSCMQYFTYKQRLGLNRNFNEYT